MILLFIPKVAQEYKKVAEALFKNLQNKISTAEGIIIPTAGQKNQTGNDLLNEIKTEGIIVFRMIFKILFKSGSF